MHRISSTLLIAGFLCLNLQVRAQDQRLRNKTQVLSPADYWEELSPIDHPSASPIPQPSSPQKPLHPHTLPKKIPAWQTRYTLGPGDTLDFSVFLRPELSRENVRIAPDGTVSFLQAVAVQANGLTPDELRDRIEEALSAYQNNLRVIITPTDVASKEFAIIGRVRRPGSYVLDRPTSILEAISLAQGIETNTVRGSAFELADFEHSFVARNGRKLDVDLARLYYRGDLTQNAYLEPDDYIFVASKLKNEIYVLGAVSHPGRLKMPARLTVAQAIAEAGGFTRHAYRIKVLIIRGSIHEPQTQIVNIKDILSGRMRDIPLRNKDIVFIDERPFELAERALGSAIFAFLQTVTAESVVSNLVPLTD
jgi:protein involved in polysaccharide export with SLBB domain